MAGTGTVDLSLKIAGGDFDDFYPYEIKLEEGFSRVCQARITVFTQTRREHKHLRELLERNMSLTVSQRLAGGLVSRQRYAHGIITGIENSGVVSRGDGATGRGGDCFRHVITMESEIARLSHTRLSCPWYRITPPDIIEEILSRYGMKGEFSDECVNRSSFSKNMKLDQVDMSDIDFIRRVMDMYGISWTFVHGKASASGLGTAELHFSEGSRFPPPFYEYSDKRKIPEIEQFDFLDYDEGRNIWKMDDWRMQGCIGVDGLEISASYPQAGYGSREWRWGDTGPGKRYYYYNSLFHGYERGTPHEEIDADIQRMIEARRLAFAGEKENWKGWTKNIMPAPGLIFRLSHFQGLKDGAAITALVTDSVLHVRSLWPRDMVSPPAGEEPGELARTEFSAVNWGNESGKRFCGNMR